MIRVRPVATLLVVAAALAMCSHARAQLADFVTLTTISDGNAGTDDRGWANVEINATAFKNQSLLTVGDHQFTSYYGADQTLILGRRNLATSPESWYLLRTGLTAVNVNDAHDVSTIGIDGDGYLHVAWGVHGNPLRYTRSDTPVVNDDPFTVPGNLAGQIPEQEAAVTYPEFWGVPGSGDLLLTYRTGSSGNGEFQLSRWNDSSDAWSAVHAREGSGSSQTGEQPWIDNDFSSFNPPPNANAYHNGLAYDSTGRLHVTWTWRTGSDSQSGFTDYQSNHNIMYAYSDNHGVDWRLADGSLLQRTDSNNITKHDIDESNAAPVILLPEGSSLINQASSAIGPDDTLYTATWYAPEAATGNHLRQYMLLAYNPYEENPLWHTYQVGNRDPENGNNRVPESQLNTYRMSRPIVLTDAENRVLVVFSDYQRGQGVTVAYSESETRDDWQFIDLATVDDMRSWEPKYDLTRWQTDGVLSMLYQPAGQGLSPTPVSVLEWDARSFFENAASAPLRLTVDRATGAVSIMNPDDATVPINGYTVSSAAGQLAPAGWNSLQDQGQGGWNETQALATLLSEANGTGSLPLAGAGSVALGNAFAGSAIDFGVDAPADLEFEYAIEGDGTRTGMVQYVGQSLNNLTLWVDPDTGKARLENTSPFSVAIDAYTITSASDSLVPSQWQSLDYQNADNGTWHEANPTTARLSELQSSGATLLSGDEAYDLGRLFNAVSGEQDLVFQFLIDGQIVSSTGFVLYQSLGIPGDYNDDGTVDAADYAIWRKNEGTTNILANDLIGGTIGAAQYEQWRSHFGETLSNGSGSGGTVPEPPGAMLILLIAVVHIIDVPLVNRTRWRASRHSETPK